MLHDVSCVYKLPHLLAHVDVHFTVVQLYLRGFILSSPGLQVSSSMMPGQSTVVFIYLDLPNSSVSKTQVMVLELV